MENIPEFLIDKLNNQYGEEIAKNIINGYAKERVTTFRVNTLKASVEEIEEELNKLDIDYKKVSWSEEVFIIKSSNEKEIEQLEIYKEGKIYLQSLSSMLPPIILEPKENMDILDMAAAPGGKTTQIAAITKNNAHITACEMNHIRAERLKYNIEKQGASSVYVMQIDSRQMNDFFSFDQILLDAPCSGSGTDNVKDLNFTQKLIEKSTKAQSTLLKKAIKMLKKGQEMVYSTCSILQCENEDIVNKILKESNCEIVPINTEKMQELPYLPTKIEGTICIAPNELYEGFFVAKIRKK